MNDVSFQLKGSAVSIVVLELYQFEAATFAQQLRDKVLQAPQFFQQSPVVISLDRLSDHATPDFCNLLNICREFNLQPLAFRSVPEHLAAQVQTTGLAVIPATQRSDSELGREVVKTVVEEKLVRRPSKVISRPVRSGQQVYAEGADLVVLAPVSEGAEVLADGDIHIYSTLRGRALAGVQGDIKANIFCQNLSAELVAIAGNFILSDALQKERWQQSAHIRLVGDSLHVSALS
ncbi:MAG: septum site-determining protein MinC [Marinobacterium sp.]|nr:septum site-determining protein MinC [Marinobacterium sp.]